MAVLHAGADNKNAFKALIAAEYSGVKVELVKNFEMGVSNKTPEFIKMNPLGKVPVLETPDGPVFESNAIARYVVRSRADNPLHGSSLIEYAHIEQWIDFATTEIDQGIARWFYPRAGFMPYLPPAEEAGIAALKRALSALNAHLANNTYLVGHSVTLADIIMTCNLYLGFVRVMTKSFTSEFPHVERYFWTMVNQPNFLKVIGEVKQAESVFPIQSQKKPAQPKESAKPKEAKKENKKEAPKEPAKPKVEAVAVDEEEAPKPKAKNPLDLLPPSKMILDEWKRLYSNTKSNFREVAIGGFWEMYDPEGYSLWFCDYKYNDENTVSFVTLNKVSGFLQRMDLVRKYAFGKMLVIGSEPPFKVKGLWLFRGKEIPQFVLDECYDMELYEWTKVDITDEAQKERVNAMIEDQEPFEGEALLEAKCFNLFPSVKRSCVMVLHAETGNMNAFKALIGEVKQAESLYPI
ncbi:putative elongation factor 1B gamma, glutathione S-transferase, Thioredoxin-like superfamily [Dioscorea sansibarensis]